MQTEEVLTRVEGPKGAADVVEVTPQATNPGATEYEVRFQGKSFRYKTLGEACIEAGELAGSPV